MSDEQWDLAAQRSIKPLAMHFVVCPHSPEHGALLDEHGRPVMTNYAKVDWKGLADRAKAALDGLVPKDVKVYVADDAVDVMDVINLSTENGMPFADKGGFEHGLQASLDQLTMGDIRAGIIPLAGNSPDIHRNKPIDGTRPPAGALVMSLRFSRGTQIIDYMDEASEALFGEPVECMNGLDFSPAITAGVMPAFLADWLRTEFGVIYGEKCSVVLLSRTFSL